MLNVRYYIAVEVKEYLIVDRVNVVHQSKVKVHDRMSSIDLHTDVLLLMLHRIHLLDRVNVSFV